MAVPVATEIRLRRASQCLDVTFDDGYRTSLPAEYLRVESPSAEVQGHSPQEKRLVFGKSGVNIAGADPIGNYAVRLRFSDGHDTGIYSWPMLYQLGQEQKERWAQYLLALEAAGKRREP